MFFSGCSVCWPNTSRHKILLNFSLIKSALQFNPLEFMRPSNNQQYCNRCLKITIGSNRSCKKKNTCSATTITHYSVSNALKYRTKLEDKKMHKKYCKIFFFYAVNSHLQEVLELLKKIVVRKSREKKAPTNCWWSCLLVKNGFK